MAKKLILAAAMPLLLALLLSGMPAQTAGATPDTDFVCKIRASGGDYTGVKAWDAAIACDITASSTQVFTVSDIGTYVTGDDGDSVTFSGGGTGTLKHISTFDKALVIDCSGTIDAGTVTCDGSGNTFEISDTGDQIGDAVASLYNDWPDGLSEYYIDLSTDWTTDSSHHIKLWTDPALSGTEGPNRHNGTAESGFYFKYTASSYGIVMRVSNVIVDGIEAQAPNCNPCWFYNTSNGFANMLKNSILHNLNGLCYNAGASTIENCIIYDFGGTGYSVVRFGTVRNCSIYADSGVGSYSGQIIVRNAECYNVLCWNANSGVGYNDYYSCTGDYNVSSDNSAPGSSSLHAQTLTDIKWESTTSGSENLHLQPGSCARDTGTELSAYFTNDIDGDTRTGSWDIGADEYMNLPPDAPTGLGPTEYVDGSPGSNNTPTLEFTQSDPEGDDIRYQIQIIHDSYGMVVDYTSELLPHPGATSFTVGQTEGSGTYSAGFEGQPLPDGDYYWQVRSRDEYDAWGTWSLAKGGDVAFQTDAITETGGSAKDKYRPSEDVSVSGSGFMPGLDVNVYVVEEGEWLGGETIADYGIVAMETFTADIGGGVKGIVWHAPLERGEYDVVFDANLNGDYDEITDFVDDPNHPGFTVTTGAVGGEVYPIDKTALLLPWLISSAILILAAGGLILIRRGNKLRKL
jgi:hypothetical protein